MQAAGEARQALEEAHGEDTVRGFAADIREAAGDVPLDEWVPQQIDASWAALGRTVEKAATDAGVDPAMAYDSLARYHLAVNDAAKESGLDVDEQAERMNAALDDAHDEWASGAAARGVSVREFAVLNQRITEGAATRAAMLSMSEAEYIAYAWNAVSEEKRRRGAVPA